MIFFSKNKESFRPCYRVNFQKLSSFFPFSLSRFKSFLSKEKRVGRPRVMSPGGDLSWSSALGHAVSCKGRWSRFNGNWTICWGLVVWEESIFLKRLVLLDPTRPSPPALEDTKKPTRGKEQINFTSSVSNFQPFITIVYTPASLSIWGLRARRTPDSFPNTAYCTLKSLTGWDSSRCMPTSLSIENFFLSNWAYVVVIF